MLLASRLERLGQLFLLSEQIVINRLCRGHFPELFIKSSGQSFLSGNRHRVCRTREQLQTSQHVILVFLDFRIRAVSDCVKGVQNRSHS